MTKKPVTHVAFVIDRSGSMMKTKRQAVDGFNGQLEEIHQNSKEQDIRCSLVTFGTEVFEHLWEEHAENLKAATYESFTSLEWTALYDAAGYTIDKLIKETDTEEEGATYLVFIISDGEDNQSKFFDSSRLNSLIKECESTGKWTFTFMGCDNLEKVSRETGIKLDNMAAWENRTAAGTARAMGQTRQRMKKYFDGKIRLKDTNDFIDLTSNFHSDEVAVAANYAQPDEGGMDGPGGEFHRSGAEVGSPADPMLGGRANLAKQAILHGHTTPGAEASKGDAWAQTECSLDKTDLFNNGGRADMSKYNETA